MNRFIKRPLSWSQLASWEYDHHEWYQTYIKNKPKGKSTAMTTGNIIGDSIGTPKSLVPALQPPGVKEYALKANLGDIHMVGFADHFCPDTLELNENKTSTNRNKWNQRSVNNHGQLTMYALMLALRNDINPEQVVMYLNYIPVIEGPDMRHYLPDPVEHYRYPTVRTTGDIEAFAVYVLDTVADMEAYTQEQLELENQKGIMDIPLTEDIR